MRLHFAAVLLLSALGIIILAVMIWGGFFWRERLRVRGALLALLVMSLLGNPFLYLYKGRTTIISLFCQFLLFPLFLCLAAYRGRRFLVPNAKKLILASVIFFSIHIPVYHGDDYSNLWRVGPGTKWDSVVSLLPTGILTGSVVVEGWASTLYNGVVALSALILYGLFCYFLAAMITVVLGREGNGPR
jgi:hypothetical protein